MEELKRVMATLFKRHGSLDMTMEEASMQMSLDLHWFPPDQAKQIVETSVAIGLLKLEDDRITPVAGVMEMDLSIGFRPDPELFDRLIDIENRGDYHRDSKTSGAVVEDTVKGNKNGPRKDNAGSSRKPNASIDKAAGKADAVAATAAKPESLPVFIRIVQAIEKESGLDKRKVIARTNSLREELDIEIETAALLVARELSVPMDSYYSLVQTELVSRANKPN